MKYFDSHAHIQLDTFDEDRSEVISSMQESGVGALIVGVDRASSEAAVALVEEHPSMWASVGLHPNDAPLEEFDVSCYKKLIAHPKVVAIGECGLDNFRPEDPGVEQVRQRALFEKHIQLAIEYDKPLMIHARPRRGTQDAYVDVIDILTSYKKEHGERVRGDIHFFVGGVEEARALLDLNFTLSYTGVVTFTHDYDETIRYIPQNMLLTETDSPFVAPVSRRGKRNDPLSIPEIVDALARIRGEDREELKETVLANSKRVFGLPGA